MSTIAKDLKISTRTMRKHALTIQEKIEKFLKNKEGWDDYYNCDDKFFQKHYPKNPLAKLLDEISFHLDYFGTINDDDEHYDALVNFEDRVEKYLEQLQQIKIDLTRMKRFVSSSIYPED